MILAIDAGNTNIVLGCLEEDGSLRFTARVSTDRGKTMDEYALILRSLFDLHGIDRRGLEGLSWPAWSASSPRSYARQ